MKSVRRISNSYNYNEILLIVKELQRTLMSFKKHFLWWYQYTSSHSQVHEASGRRTQYRSVWTFSGPTGRNVPRCILYSYGTV
jgi:hypothetical protein